MCPIWHLSYCCTSGRKACKHTYTLSYKNASFRTKRMRKRTKIGILIQIQIQKEQKKGNFVISHVVPFVVEVTGFEPATFWSRSHPPILHFIQTQVHNRNKGRTRSRNIIIIIKCKYLIPPNYHRPPNYSSFSSSFPSRDSTSITRPSSHLSRYSIACSRDFSSRSLDR